MGTEALLGLALIFAAAGAAFALLAWRRERARAEAEAGHRDVQEGALRREVELREEDLRDRDAELDAQRRESERERARAARERDHNRELRGKIAELQAHHGALGPWRDVQSLVLETAVSLTEAEKGILLARQEGDELEVVAHSGFDEDPRLDHLAQRFGSEALEREKTVREEDLLAVPIYIRHEMTGVIVCVNEEGAFHGLEDEVLLAMGDHAGAILQNAQLHGELRGSYLATVTMLAEAIQAKDPFLRGHSEEVCTYVGALAERMDIGGGRRERLVFGSLLHDVGKIGISERILHKPGRLTPEEFAIVQLHPRIGYRLLEQVPALREIAPAILHHHERYDGGGYPAGLRGEQIPLEARIVAVADAFSAMTTDRPYRARMPLEEACSELERSAGTQFDPEIVRLFCEEVRKAPQDTRDRLPTALDDAELQIHRSADEPVLGAGAIALTDNLTLLYSHRHLHEAAAAESERARLQGDSFVVVLVSVDAVPEVNATRGYAEGDALLRRAARAVSALAVRSGATAAREGGIVLALLAPGANVADEEALAREIAGALRAEAGEARVAAIRSLQGEDGEAAIARASAALQAAPGAERS